MDVFVSKSKGSKVYHRPGCHYIDRISIYYGKICTKRRAIRNGYCACKYCGGTAGLHRMNRKALQKAAAGTKLETFYDDKTSTFYLRTGMNRTIIPRQKKVFRSLIRPSGKSGSWSALTATILRALELLHSKVPN